MVIQGQVDALIEEGNLTEAEANHLSLLGALVCTWAQDRVVGQSLSPLDMLRAWMRDGGYRQKDLVAAVFPTASIACTVLRGRRHLTSEYVQKLAHLFHVSPTVFIEVPFDRMAEQPRS